MVEAGGSRNLFRIDFAQLVDPRLTPHAPISHETAEALNGGYAEGTRTGAWLERRTLGERRPNPLPR